MSDGTYAVIMAGGRGERFWPMSTGDRPKQVLDLFGEKPLVQEAVDRPKGVVDVENIIIITNATTVDPIRKCVPELPPGNVIGEPVGRDTAAACALGCAVVKARDPNGVLCVLTADHIIKDAEIFRQTLTDSASLAREQDVLITIGIQPTYASTGFGYIEFGEALSSPSTIPFSEALRFVEKPDAETAERYLEDGHYCWNSGMFIWSVKAFNDAISKHRPQLIQMMDRMASEAGTETFNVALAEEYGLLEKISIDYAVMEKADNIVMARGGFRWYDVGSWPALADHFPMDGTGNTVVGNAELVDAEANIVVSKGRLTGVIGVDNLVVIQSKNATLVCARERAQDVKELVRRLEARGDCTDVL